jgi:predicted kinase
MATLHFICGKAASGKTTLARELAASHSAVLFSEDEWLTRLDAEINSLADHVRYSKRLKAALAPLAVRLLQLGVPIVFDFADNTPNDRAGFDRYSKAPMSTMCCIISSRPMNRAKCDCACAMRPSRKDSISALPAKTGSTRSRDVSHRHQIKKTSM